IGDVQTCEKDGGCGEHDDRKTPWRRPRRCDCASPRRDSHGLRHATAAPASRVMNSRRFKDRIVFCPQRAQGRIAGYRIRNGQSARTSLAVGLRPVGSAVPSSIMRTRLKLDQSARAQPTTVARAKMARRCREANSRWTVCTLSDGRSGLRSTSPNGSYGMSTRGGWSYSGLMPADLITLANFSVEIGTRLPEGGRRPGKPGAAHPGDRGFDFGSVRPTLISLLSLSMISAGVFLGAPTPCQPLAS